MYEINAYTEVSCFGSIPKERKWRELYDYFMYRFPEFKLADWPWLLWSASWNHLGTFSTPSTTWNPPSTCQLKITSAKSWASSTEVSLLYMKDNRRRAFPLWNRSPLFYYNVGEQTPFWGRPQIYRVTHSKKEGIPSTAADFSSFFLRCPSLTSPTWI